MDSEQRLLVTLEARMNKYERDLERARAKTSKNMKGMEDAAKRSAQNMEKSYADTGSKIAERLQLAFKPMLAGGAIAAAATAFKQIATTVAEVGREADKARVSAKVWQQWTYVAKATGASVDGVTDALKELNIRGDEFARTGKGSAQEAFERLGLTAADVAERLKDPSAFLDEIIGKLQKMDSAAQARNLDELFGGTGAEELSKMLGLSVEQLQKLRSEAALFSDDQLKAAKDFDAQWETVWRNVQVYAKQAALESVSYIKQIASAISALKGDNIIATSRNYALSDEGRLNTYLERRADILKRIADIRNKPDFDNDYDGLALERLEADLADVDNQIAALTPHTKEFAAALKEMSNITLGVSGNMNNAATSAANFKQALTDLKNLVPELKAELDELAKLDQIDKAFQQAVKNAKTPADIEEANRIAARARTVASYGDQKDFFSLVKRVESGGNYNATLDHGRWTNGPQNLTGMTLDQIIALQDRMLTPENRNLYRDKNGNPAGSSALGAYQITRRTLKGSMKALGLAGDTMFDETTQDAIARYLARSRGNDVEGLRNEWEGLRRVDPDTIRSLYNQSDLSPVKVAPSESQQKATDDAKKATEARKQLNDSLRESQSLAELERKTVGMSAQQRGIELEVFRRVQDAKRQGLSLSDQDINKIRQQITATASLNRETENAQRAINGAQEAKQYFAESFTSSLSGLITGTTSLSDAVSNLANNLMDAVLQATLLGKGPLATLFGFGGAGQPSGLLGSLLGFAEGGFTGAGGKYEPAGVVHKGEYVLSAPAVKRLGVKNLEALHQNAKRGYADGGYVGRTSFARPANMNTVSTTNNSPAVNISAPVTVNANGGTPEQNADLAKQTSKAMENTMRGIVADEIHRAMRPGNSLNNRTRRR
ncbi:phage tail tape measure protein [Ochrobactrum sp. Q0168]|uniref:phage tail tape measure protein n=1 Tax=Ochrobactrum sp. Q0168 TaxID=2793241 RepID=UPI0018EAB376